MKRALLVHEWLIFVPFWMIITVIRARFALIAERMDRIDCEAFPEHLKCPVVQCYRRTVIGARHTDTEPGFEAVLAHWRLQCVTPIHGHPPVLMYRALSGLYRMTMYRLKNGVPVAGRGSNDSSR